MIIAFDSRKITNRLPWNPNVVEGGALNANFQDVEATVIVADSLASHGWRYQKDWYFKTCGLSQVVLEFYNEECAAQAFILFEGHYTK